MRDVNLGGTVVTLAPRADIAIERTPLARRPAVGQHSTPAPSAPDGWGGCIVAERPGVSAIAGALTHPAVPHL
ncbi:MAG: hypothetical protein M3R63_16545 [Actinomycetota bacterium]|nr:hypothetical protein [Actinomycetota bacterium]